MTPDAAKIFVAVLFIIIGWFLFREINCWYFKINQIVKLLETISRKLGADPDTELGVKK